MKLLRWSDSDRREPVGPVNGRNRSPTGWSRPADCRTCPTLRNLFPTSPSSFSPISPFFSSSSFAFWDQTRLPAVRITRLPPSSSSIRQLQLFQWIDHNVFVTSYSPATRTIHSVGQRPRRPARQRHAVLPPSRGPRHKSISHPWLAGFPASAPAQLPWVPAWVSRYASTNVRP